MNNFQFSKLGLMLGILTFLIILGMLIFHFFIVRRFKKVYLFFHSYLYWAIIGSLSFTYFLSIRWIPYVEEYFKFNFLQNNDIYEYSITISRTFLLDLCPAVAFILPFTLIVDKTKTLAKIISPYAIIGSVVTIYSTVLSTSDNVDWIQYIFLGDTENRLFFMMHFISLLLSIGIMLVCKKYTSWSTFGSFLFIAFYIAYVTIFVDLKNVLYNTTGVSKLDWYDDVYGNFSEYGMVYDLFKIPFPIIKWVMYFFAVIVQLFMILIKNSTTHDINKNISLDHRWYLKIPYLNSICLKYDVFLVNIFSNLRNKFKNNNKL